MVSFDDQDLTAAVRDADSPDWSVLASAGRRLAASNKIDRVADVLHRLLLDLRDSGVTRVTPESLPARKDTDRLIHQLHELAADDDAGVRDEAQEILSHLRPRKEQALDSDDDQL